MKMIDRLILGALAVGIWVLVAIQVTSNTRAYASSIAASIDAYEVDGLRSYVARVVEDCSVSGEVHMYSEDYGSLESVTISC